MSSIIENLDVLAKKYLQKQSLPVKLHFKVEDEDEEEEEEQEGEDSDTEEDEEEEEEGV